MPNNRSTIPLAVRFWAKVQKTDTCWLWTGATRRNGYGAISGGRSSKGLQSHRVAYELTYGPIPDDMFVCHRCDNPRCVRPDHLFLGTPQANVDDMIKKSRHMHGERHTNTRLTWNDVRAIRAQYAAGGISMSKLGALFHVRASTVGRIVLNQTWVESHDY